MRVRHRAVRADRVWSLLAVTAVAVTATLGAPASTPAGGATSDSSVTAVMLDPSSPQVLNSSAGHGYERVFGTITGVVGVDDNVRGLTGPTTYTAQFELVFPAGAPSSSLLVEAENRGMAIAPRTFDDVAQGSGSPATTTWSDYTDQPYGGLGFLLDGRRSWARVQWQSEMAEGVGADTQGIGLVIVRDFGRMLAGEGSAALLDELGVEPYHDRVLVGVSQSAWFVDTFIAEGFNQDPSNHGRGVYQAALTIDGAGTTLAINNGAGSAPETAYALPDARPLQPKQILRRPKSDPYLVDMAAYTDFYRLRAGLFGAPRPASRMRRYDVPSAHAPAAFVVPAIVFDGFRCNDGTAIPLNPLDYRPYARAFLAEMEKELVARRSESQRITGRFLPPSTVFKLGPVARDALTFNGQQAFNALSGTKVPVPRTDKDQWPIGGVRDPAADHPLGRPIPPSIPHVGLDDINDICGNFGGYEPFTKSELTARYGSRAKYLESYTASLNTLIRKGFILPIDRPGMLTQAAAHFDDAP